MNICGDAILRDGSPEWAVTERAIVELDLLDQIMKADAKDAQKCKAILGLIEGRGCEAIANAFVEEVLKEQPAPLARLAEIANGSLNPRERRIALFKLLERSREEIGGLS